MIQARAFVVCGLAIGLLVGSAAAGVIVVDPLGRGFTDISPAVVASNDGDVILVKGGDYGPVTVAGKSLTIVAELGEVVRILGSIEVRSIPAGKRVVLDGLTADATYVTSPIIEGLRVLNCAGVVRVQQCEFVGGLPNGSINSQCHTSGVPDAPSAVLVLNSSNVAFVSCRMEGKQGSNIWNEDCHMTGGAGGMQFGGAGGSGIRMLGSSVTIYDSTLNGGNSGSGGYCQSAGSAASVSNGSRLVLVGSRGYGGSGGQSFDSFSPSQGGTGGCGVAVYEDSEVRLLDNELVGGTTGGGWGIPDGPPVAPVGGGGLITTWSGDAPVLSFSRLLRETQATPIKVTGPQGHLVLLFVSFQSVGLATPKAKGTFMLNPAQFIGPMVLGNIGPSGKVSIAAVIPHLPASLSSLELYLQALLTGPSGPVLSSWGQLTILDDSF